MIHRVALTVALLVVPSFASAQSSNLADAPQIASETTLSNYSARIASGLARPKSAKASGVDSRYFLQPVGTRKEPILAGWASAILPGAGSFYAGNNRHGVIHAGVALASLVVMVAGTGACYTADCGGGMATVGYLGYLVNDVWSIFTAVSDANTFNAKGATPGGRVVGQLFLDPELHVVVASRASRATRVPSQGAELQVQVLSWKF